MQWRDQAGVLRTELLEVIPKEGWHLLFEKFCLFYDHIPGMTVSLITDSKSVLIMHTPLVFSMGFSHFLNGIQHIGRLIQHLSMSTHGVKKDLLILFLVYLIVLTILLREQCIHSPYGEDPTV